MRRMVRQSLNLVMIAACLPLLAIGMRAQEGKLETAPPKQPVPTTYRVEYTIREIEGGKVLNTRKYMLMAESDSWASSRVGNRVPIIGEKGVTYESVGMNIQCRVRERDDVILVETRIESSSVVPREQAPETSANPNPLLRSVSSNVTAAVSLGKPTVIGIMDDTASNHRFEIEATVTGIK